MAIIEKMKGRSESDKENKRFSEAPPAFSQEPPKVPSKEQPPSYAANEASPEELNSAFSKLHLADAPANFPEPDHCLAHLKLLSAFHALKEDVGYTDGLFGLWNGICERAQNKEEALARMREKRWALYIARAAERFESWWLQVLCNQEPSKRLQCKEMVVTNLDYLDFYRLGKSQKWNAEILPPIDVLMVWHSFMLNPRSYYEDCLRFGLKSLWSTGMPWAAVDAAIDTNFNYNVPETAKTYFVGKTGYNWANAEDSLAKVMNCPRCSQRLEIPWTTCGSNEKQSPEYILEMNGTGYGDRSFSYICHKCGGELEHELLRVAKFKKETENLILRDWPLGGTILSPTTGDPDRPLMTDMKHAPNTFPNRLVGLELRSKILELVTDQTNGNPTMEQIHPTMDHVKKLIEAAILKKDVVKRVNSKGTFETSVLKRPERLAIRKMMSRYWENSSIFALELGGAVIRQGVFVDKMHDLDWLHSPAANNTMVRLLEKYRRFIQIMSQYPLHTCVPTLDVDLAWHTHQLSPFGYHEYTVARCRKFIDHDDKISEDALETAFEWTSKTYEKLFLEVYSECTCWYCEAIRSKHIGSGRIFGTSKHEKALNNFYESGAAELCPPSNSAHVSAHSAVKVDEDAARAKVYGSLRSRRKQELDTAYTKAQRRAKAKGRTLPPKDEYYYGAWGYPYMMYGPYMSMGMMGGVYYAGDPCAMPVGTGMPGNCAAGTCGAGVAAGGCGGPGGCGGIGQGGGGGSAGACGGTGSGMSGGGLSCGGGGGGGACGGGGGGGGCGGGGC